MHIWRNICTSVLICILTAAAYAGPVRESASLYRQPDGTTFTALLKGDEWLKSRTTEDGCAIVRDKDGWWCYGIYDREGRISSTGHHVGDIVPQEIIDASRMIPYDILSQNAAARRAVNGIGAEEAIAAIRRQAAVTKSGAGKFTKKGIALLVQFNDTRFQFRREDFHDLLNMSGYNGTGSAKDYYEDQFGEGWEFIFDVSKIITLPWPSEHYGANDADETDIRPWDMVAEACRQADDDIDFSEYDQNGDGKVDNVYVFYAGKSEAEHKDNPELIWPHQYYIYSGTPGIDLVLDGKRIDRYACSAEISGERSLTGIGSFCHEYGHTLGLKDLYDTNYDKKDGWAAGVWSTTSLMDSGNYNNNSATPPNFNCIEREMLGLTSPVMLKEGHSCTLEPIHLNGAYARLDTDTEGEYYLFECRSNEGWDRYIGGKGMLVYHIDRNETEVYGSQSFSRWDMNTVNASAGHQCADLIEADNRPDEIMEEDKLRQDISGIFFPQDDATSITPAGIPQLKFWSGEQADVAVTGIKMEGDIISFNVVGSSEKLLVPSVTDPAFTSFPDGAVIWFSSSDPSIEGMPVLKWRKSGSNAEFALAYPSEYAKGQYVCKLDGLENGNVTYETKIAFETENAVGKTYKLSFMTKRKPPVSWPYIYISDQTANPDRGLVLHTVNTSGCAAIEWSFDGETVDTAGNPCFHPTRNGILKAVIHWNDGSRDTIIKNIEVRR